MASTRAAASAGQLPMDRLASKSESPSPGGSDYPDVHPLGQTLADEQANLPPGARGAVKVEWQLAVGWPVLIVAEPAALGQPDPTVRPGCLPSRLGHH